MWSCTCGCCYVCRFKLINYLQFKSYYTKCPGCMEMIKCSDILTISQEIEKHPNSNPSLFYKNALIQCDNNGCNQILSLSNWYKHIKFNCDYRIVHCPAIECSVKGNPNDILTHSLQCPFHTVWCAGCKINWTVLAIGHNCEKVKNTINFEVMIIIHFDTWSLLKMELLFSKLKFK